MEAKYIYLVDDDKDFGRLMSHIIENDGHYVKYESNPFKALQELNTQIKPDLILSDLLMPKLDGISFLKKLKSSGNYNEANFCFLSASHDERHLHDAFINGASDYILKGQDKTCLIERINLNLQRPHPATKDYISLLEVTDVINDFKIVHFDDKKITIKAQSELPLNAQIKINSRCLRPLTGNSDYLECIVDQCHIEDDSVTITCHHHLKSA